MRARTQGPRAFGLAAGLSLAAHVCLLLLLRAVGLVAGDLPAFAAWSWMEPLAPSSPWQDAPIVDLTSEAEALAPAEPAPRVEGDAAGAGASARGLGDEARRAAADRGDAEGRTLPPSWRHDTSTLRDRLSDGADVYQPSRERNAMRPSSPQAVRRERRVGQGDSAHRERASGEEPRVAAPAGAGDDARPATAVERAAAAGTGEGARRADGPLAAAAGARAFDTDVSGPARDVATARAASDEPRPGLMDLAAASAPGPADGRPGRGPATQPGASPVAAARPAMSPPGASTVATTDGVGAGTAERQYARQYLEIQRKVGSVMRFPRRLALMLEQGESIVRFGVRADGRLAGEVQLVKSAGFIEFDDEAVSAVQRAAPFPAPGRALTVELRVPFRNPIVR